jgi:hypothetical protein
MKRRSIRRLSRAVRRLYRSSRRGLRRLRKKPPAIRVAVLAAVLVSLWLAINWTYQALRKPTEFFFPVSGALAKSPAETWRSYGPLFEEHSTAVMTPSLLAALAQVEGAGNPVARTSWRWRAAWNPLEVYTPASSAVGMYQITDGTFAQERRTCIHDHVAIEDPSSCWFNFLYCRVVPTHAIEMTSAFLDRRVAGILERRRRGSVALESKQDLAAVIHLCGEGPADAYASRGFHPAPHERCGEQGLAAYLLRVRTMERVFARMVAHD